MKRIAVYFLCAFFLSGTIAFPEDFVVLIIDTVTEEEQAEYEALNEAEDRLLEYKDSPEALHNKLIMLSMINQSRENHKAPPVRLDILASRVANKQAKEAAEKGFSGHWNTAGEKPYHRYAFSGGVDHVAENAASFWTSGTIDPSRAVTLMNDSHDRFMAERAPNDGHKKNVIAKEHTHVGLGYYLTDKTFRYYEEYIDRYIEFISYESTVKAGAQTTVIVRPLDPSLSVYAAIGYYEAKPSPLTPSQLNAKGAYPDYTNSTAFSLWPWQLPKKEDGTWEIAFTPKQKGLYYINIYLDSKPYTGGQASTKGKLQASGLVITTQ